MFNYLMRLFYGLPPYDSRELIQAKNYRPKCKHDPHFPETKNGEKLTSQEIEAAAKKIYKGASEGRLFTR